jgi:hypothetical protein
VIRSECQAGILRNRLKDAGPAERSRIEELLADYDADAVLKATVERSCANARPTPPRASAEQATEPSDPQWPFGRHKGKPLSRTPSDYLAWGAENLKGKFAKWCRDEMDRREVGQ